MAAEAAQPSLLSAGGRVRRRKRRNKAVEISWLLASGLAVAVLAVVTISVFLRGLKALDLDLFTKTAATFGESGGGIAHAFVGSIVLVAIGAAIALPFGVLTAIYVSEFAHHSLARPARRRRCCSPPRCTGTRSRSTRTMPLPPSR